ncbi:unnamed protein product, partial [Meganyctiphanes norvegica]
MRFTKLITLRRQVVPSDKMKLIVAGAVTLFLVLALHTTTKKRSITPPFVHMRHGHGVTLGSLVVAPKFNQKEAMKDMKQIQLNILRDFIGKDLPPWLDSSLNQTLPALGSPLLPNQVRRVLIVTTWRSGSTFLGDLINNWPGTFYYFEPLRFISENSEVPAMLEASSSALLRTLLSCSLDQRHLPFLQYITSARNNFMIRHNHRATPLCRKVGACMDPSLHSLACSLHPMVLAKAVRLPLHAAVTLLKDRDLNLHVIHLVRDPRGVLKSRTRMPWCKSSSCSNLETVCHAINRDAVTSKRLRSEFPNQYLLLRYEDLAQRPFPMTRRIFEFLNLPLMPELAIFLDQHTNQQAAMNSNKDGYSYGSLYNTYRNSSVASSAWRTSITPELAREVNPSCMDKMAIYDEYLLITYIYHL